MIDPSGAIVPYAERIASWESKGGRQLIDFPVEYPTAVPPETSLGPSVLEASRAFPIDGPDKEVYHGYKIVLGIPGNAGLTEYFGVSGTTWEDPPILDNPSEVKTVDGREYLLFFDGDRLRLVGWKERKRSYWVSNTLLQSLEEDEMFKIAQSMHELGK